jgi:hypothetical protein
VNDTRGGNENFWSSFLDPASYKFEISTKATPKKSDEPEKATGAGVFLKKKFSKTKPL